SPSAEETQWLVERLTRRAALRRGAQAAALGGLALAGLGGGDALAEGGAGQALVVMNYPGWMGNTTVAEFKKATGISVKQVAGLTSGVSAAAAQIAQNKGQYDMSLGGPVLGEQLRQGHLLQPVSAARVPNIKYVAKHFRDAYPWGPPTDFG